MPCPTSWYLNALPPPFNNSLNDSKRLSLSKQEMNKIIIDDIYRQYVQVTWLDPLGGFRPEMAFYAEHSLVLRDDLIV